MTRVSQGTVIQLNISSTTIVYKSYITFSGGHFVIFFWGGENLGCQHVMQPPGNFSPMQYVAEFLANQYFHG